MYDRGLQKSSGSQAKPTLSSTAQQIQSSKPEHKFSVKNLLRQSNNANRNKVQVEIDPHREPVICRANYEDQLIKDDFSSWITSPGYNAASKYVGSSSSIIMHI